MEQGNMILRHFENIKAASVIGLQRGVFSDFETVVAVKQSLDAVEQYLKDNMLRSNGTESKIETDNKVHQQ